jgi:hypothetical protein
MERKKRRGRRKERRREGRGERGEDKRGEKRGEGRRGDICFDRYLFDCHNQVGTNVQSLCFTTP